MQTVPGATIPQSTAGTPASAASVPGTDDAVVREVLRSRTHHAVGLRRISHRCRRRPMRRAKESGHMPSPPFAELGVSPGVVRALSARGVDTPFAVQEMVIED